MILVMGENGSGKSAFAEKLTLKLGGERCYIATMIPCGDEGAKRVEKHRAQRAGMGFTTLELPYAVGGAQIPANAVVLLEDVSNLLANALFERGAIAERVLQDIRALDCRCRALIAVTISGLNPDDSEGETRGYVKALHALNESLFALSDTVVEMRGGQPRLRKGEWDAFI